MIQIALRYSTSKLSNLAYDSGATNQALFYPAEWTKPLIETFEDKGKLLNGNNYSHLLYKHYNYNLIISTDEIQSSDITFLENFWQAQFKYIAVKESTTFGNYVRVNTEGGPIPFTFIENIEFLPEFTLKLQTMEKL